MPPGGRYGQGAPVPDGRGDGAAVPVCHQQGGTGQEPAGSGQTLRHGGSPPCTGGCVSMMALRQQHGALLCVMLGHKSTLYCHQHATHPAHQCSPPTSCKHDMISTHAGLCGSADSTRLAGMPQRPAGAGQSKHCAPATSGWQGWLDRADTAQRWADGSRGLGSACCMWLGAI